MQQGNSRIPRWVVENDPSWEKSIDSAVGMLKWTKKGTGVTAVCSPTSMLCDLIGADEQTSVGLSDAASRVAKRMQTSSLAGGADDISKFLTSRYLNPGINGPRPDLKRSFRSSQ